jgi:hypothetical protein
VIEPLLAPSSQPVASVPTHPAKNIVANVSRAFEHRK